MPLPLLAIGGAAVGNELNKSGGGIFGKALGGIKGLFGKKKSSEPVEVDSLFSKIRTISGQATGNPLSLKFGDRSLQNVSKWGAKITDYVDPSVLHGPTVSEIIKAPVVKKESSSKEMNGLGQFMQGVSGGFTFGQNQKLVNIAFWVIGGIVVILIIRPFGILSGSRRKRR